ncbi:hypothetical protein B0T17DRAFT_616552 [Bombardia bombarda]|uniref:Uncharacterized protein n=1 Tax=Bombardia bombarda TaxID=252184 RepID=A0AA40CB70_9PEZI|nr:hypothetical protein B0T17DRAFT_616552 [Bombardia bombarda]
MLNLEADVRRITEEMEEFNLPLGCDDGTASSTAIEEWGLQLQEAAALIRLDVRASSKHTQQMRDQGFQNVREARLKAPIGPWAKGKIQKELGMMGLSDLYDHL